MKYVGSSKDNHSHQNHPCKDITEQSQRETQYLSDLTHKFYQTNKKSNCNIQRFQNITYNTITRDNSHTLVRNILFYVMEPMMVKSKYNTTYHKKPSQQKIEG